MSDSEGPAIVVRALGVPVAIPVTDPDTAERLRHQWARALTDESPRTRIAEEDADRSTDELDELERDYVTTTRVTLAALAATAGERLNLHAGAVADPSGAALAVVGASGAGKTTAIRALAGRLDYLSDETVSVEPGGLTLHPHPKPLSVIADASRSRRKESLSPDDLGLGPTPASARLHRIVLLRRGEQPSGLHPVSTPEAIVEIVPQTSSLVLLDHPLLTLAGTIDACGGAFALGYEEIGDQLDALTSLLADDLPEPPSPDHHPAGPRLLPGGDDWSRAPWVDAVRYDDQAVVLVGDNAVLLDGLGTTLWCALSRPAPSAALVAEAERTHGSHPSAGALVADALAEMARRGVLVPPALVGGEADPGHTGSGRS